MVMNIGKTILLVVNGLGFQTDFCVGRKEINVTIGGQQCETTVLAVGGVMLSPT